MRVLACCWHCSFLACCWHCSFLACRWPCITLFWSSIIHHVDVLLASLLGAAAGLSITPCVTFSCTARSFTSCAWSAGLTSTTVLSLRALRVKGSPLSSVALVSRPRRSLALVASLSTNTTMFSRMLLRPLGRAPTEALQVAVVTALAMCLMVSGHFSAQTRSF